MLAASQTGRSICCWYWVSWPCGVFDHLTRLGVIIRFDPSLVIPPLLFFFRHLICLNKLRARLCCLACQESKPFLIKLNIEGKPVTIMPKKAEKELFDEISKRSIMLIDTKQQGVDNMSKQIGYVRVSSVDQDPARQLENVTLDKVFIDKQSGAKKDRPNLQACIEYLRDDDVLHVHSIDRLARNLGDLQSIVSDLTERGITIRFVKENMTFSASTANDPMQILMFQMLGAFAQFERSLIRERQREGIAIAKAAGKHLGRAPKLTGEQIKILHQELAAGTSVASLAEKFGVSRQTIYNLTGKRSK